MNAFSRDFGPCRFVEGKACRGAFPKNSPVSAEDTRQPCPDRQACLAWRYGPRLEQQRAARAKRTVPLPTKIRDGKPRCRWCTGEITLGRAKQRSWHDGREGEPNCLFQYRLHSDRPTQFEFVAERDGLKCWDCGKSPERWRFQTWNGEAVVTRIMGPWIDRRDARIEWIGPYVSIERVTALELEHEVPIWRTTHMSDDERRPYFGPTNLRLRCGECHGPKTKAEAKQRAKEKRQAKLAQPKEPARRPLKGRSSFGKGGKLQGRGFQTTKTRGLDGQVRARKPRKGKR